MSEPDAEVAALADRIALAVRCEESTEHTQQLVVSLVARAGWQRTRRLVLDRALRGRAPAASGV